MKTRLAALLLSAALPAAAWTPPANPDPQAILREAVDDRIAGRYEDALAKQEWFHARALKYRPALRGVRNSFAIAWWAELAELYAPARASLLKVRDDAVRAVREGRDVEGNFADLAAIDREIDDPLTTVSLFLEMDKRDPAIAKRVAHWAEEPLVDAKYFQVAARYADPEAELRNAIETYRRLKARPAPSRDVDFAALNEKFLGTSAGRLVALLVLVERRPEAEKIAREALEASGSETVKGMVDAALQGQVPPPFIDPKARRAAKPS